MAANSRAVKPNWSEVSIVWRQPGPWIPPFSKWLRPVLKTGATVRLRKCETSDFYVDDSEWLELLQS